MKTPKISIIVPVYQAEPYLRKCLDSIVNQTHKNLEIILIDDGSPDNCGAICDEYAEKDSRIVVIHQRNAGVSAARNAGLLAATGAYIGFIDSDDYVDHDLYEHLLQTIERYDANIAQCGIIFETSSERWVEYCPPNTFCSRCGEIEFPGQAWVWYNNSIWNKLYRAEIAKCATFDPDLSYGEDLLYHARIIDHVSTIAFSCEPKYHYVQQKGSISHTLSMQRRFDTVINLLEQNMPDSREHANAHHFLCRAQFLTVADFAMQVARFCNKNATFRATIRNYARAFEKTLTDTIHLTIGEKLKMLLISRFWWLYRSLILVRYRWKH